MHRRKAAMHGEQTALPLADAPQGVRPSVMHRREAAMHGEQTALPLADAPDAACQQAVRRGRRLLAAGTKQCKALPAGLPRPILPSRAHRLIDAGSVSSCEDDECGDTYLAEVNLADVPKSLVVSTHGRKAYTARGLKKEPGRVSNKRPWNDPPYEDLAKEGLTITRPSHRTGLQKRNKEQELIRCVREQKRICSSGRAPERGPRSSGSLHCPWKEGRVVLSARAPRLIGRTSLRRRKPTS
ncbi:hypothetical protein MRX96_051727 [Rhipicephalus microplus]